MAGIVDLKMHGSWNRIKHFLRAAQEKRYLAALDRCGEFGVQLLMASTPKRTGLTAMSWSYSIEGSGDDYKILFNNSNIKDGNFNIALLIQMGHGTGTGGYVAGVDYINPVLGPIADYLGEQVGLEIAKL